MSVKSATSAPKAVAESLGNVQKGTGDKAVGVGLDSMSVKSAVDAPKAVAEGIPISARTGAGQTDVAGVTYDDEPEEAVEEVAEEAADEAADEGAEAYDEGEGEEAYEDDE